MFMSMEEEGHDRLNGALIFFFGFESTRDEHPWHAKSSFDNFEVRAVSFPKFKTEIEEWERIARYHSDRRYWYKVVSLRKT